MIHAISQPDWAAGDEPRRIVWDDETGAVSGDHHAVPRLRGWMADAIDAGHIRLEEGTLDLPDPRHVPAQFLAVLRLALGTAFDPGALPAPLRGVEPVAWRQQLPPGVVA